MFVHLSLRRIGQSRAQRPALVRPGLLKILGITFIAGAMIALAGCGGASTKSDSSPEYKTITPGTLTVGIQAYMPYTGIGSGKLVGLDGDIMNRIAAKLDLKVKPVQSDFAGVIASIQSGPRVDVGIGTIGWTKERAAVGVYTDPTYYSPIEVITRRGETYPTLQSLEGKTVGTVTGYFYIPALKVIPGATMRTYPTAANMYADVIAGRLDAGFVDPLINVAAAKKNDKLSTNVLEPASSEQLQEHPEYKVLLSYQAVFYLPKGYEKLANAMTKEIRSMYENGTMAEILQKWGVSSLDVWLTPPTGAAGAAKERIGVDRGEGWEPPKAAS